MIRVALTLMPHSWSSEEGMKDLWGGLSYYIVGGCYWNIIHLNVLMIPNLFIVYILLPCSNTLVIYEGCKPYGVDCYVLMSRV